MQKSLNKETISLLGIMCVRVITTIFLGPFLIAYFIQQPEGSIATLASFYMLSYLFSSIFWYFTSWFSNHSRKLLTLRLGIIINCIYVLLFIILQDRVLDFIPLMAIFNGLALATFYTPFNILRSIKVPNQQRRKYEIAQEALGILLQIVIPIALGFLITATDYARTASIILILCGIELFLSLFISAPKELKRDRYNPFQWLRSKFSDKTVITALGGEILKGCTINGALGVVVTVFIINAFKTSINLGIITSISYVLSLVFTLIYKKYFIQNDKKVIAFCSILPAILVIILALFTSSFMVFLYSLTYSALISVLTICGNTRIFNLPKTSHIAKTDQVEFWFTRELALNIGRIISYGLLFVITLFCNNLALYIFVVCLALLLIPIGKITKKIDSA